MGDQNLESLFVREEEVSRDLLARVLNPYVRIMQDSKKPSLTEEGFKLKPTPMILVCLLVSKVIKVLGKADDPETYQEGYAPKELEKFTGLPGGTVRSNLKRLKDNRIIDVHNGWYYIPNFRLTRVEDILLGD